MTKYVTLIVCTILLYIFASKLIDFITSVRIKRGRLKIIKIFILDNETTVFNHLDQKLFTEPNNVLYTDGKGKAKRAILFGEFDKEDKSQINFKKQLLSKKNFIQDLDEIMEVMNDFWYQYITYYILKCKRELRISSFIIASASVQIDVTSKRKKEKIKLGLEEAIQTKKPKLFNIIDIK